MNTCSLCNRTENETGTFSSTKTNLPEKFLNVKNDDDDDEEVDTITIFTKGT